MATSSSLGSAETNLQMSMGFSCCHEHAFSYVTPWAERFKPDTSLVDMI